MQEPDAVLIPDESPVDNNNVHKVVHRKPKGGKSWQSQAQVEEEHWQWTTLKRKKSPVFNNNNNAQSYESEYAPPKPEFFTRAHIEHNAAEEPGAQQGSRPKATEKTSTQRVEDVGNNAEINNNKVGSRSQAKCEVEIPQLELTKVKEIKLQAKLETGGAPFVCQQCQAAVATSRGELGFHRRYPSLLFFCIFLNLMSILSFLFCISVLRTVFPHPAF